MEDRGGTAAELARYKLRDHPYTGRCCFTSGICSWQTSCEL